MKVLLGCEQSQAVCVEFRKRGHEAYSCDILPCSGGHPEWHIQEDVVEVIKGGVFITQSGNKIFIDKWDMGIFFTPCTYSCNSGVRWLAKDGIIINQERYYNMIKYAGMLRDCLTSNIDRVACENPIPHKYALEIIGRKYNQIVQPYDFGHTTSKGTCLWLKNLPPLKQTHKRVPKVNRTYDIHKMPPGPDQAKLRSKTFSGIAKAMAEQWGCIESNYEPQLKLFAIQ